MPTYTWIIERLDCYPERDGQTNVLFIVHWRLNAQDGEYGASGYGTVNLTYDRAAPFTPYADLTQQQVIGWVQDALGTEQCAEITANLAAQIANRVNPPAVTPPLPWSA